MLTTRPEQAVDFPQFLKLFDIFVLHFKVDDEFTYPGTSDVLQLDCSGIEFPTEGTLLFSVVCFNRSFNMEPVVREVCYFQGKLHDQPQGNTSGHGICNC